MNRYFFTLLAIIMAVCSAPTFAQDTGIFLPDHGEIKVFSDETYDDGVRVVSTDEFLVGSQLGATAFLSFHALIPAEAGLRYGEWTWYVTLSVSYENGEFHGMDTSAPFNKNDRLRFEDYESGKSYKMEFLTRFEDTDDGWHSAAFQFDLDGLREFLNGNEAKSLKFSQGAGSHGPGVGFQCIGLGLAVYESLIAILNRVPEQKYRQ